jgi:hypothetical protein
VFTIQFTYQGVDAYRVVNDDMPLQTLYIMARSFLQTDFRFRIPSEDEIDLFYDTRWLQRHGGVLVDIPVLEGAIITVVYPRQGLSQSSTPSRPPVHRGLHAQDTRVEVSPAARSS